MTKLMNQKQIAQHLGLTTRRVRDLIGLGVLCEARPGRYDPRECDRGLAGYRDPRGPAMAGVMDELSREVETLDRRMRALDPSDADFLDRARAATALIEKIDGLWRLVLAPRPEAERAMVDVTREALVADALMRVIEMTREHVAQHGLPAGEAA